MSFIREWVISIVSVIIIVVFLDILLPKGNMKKYANFVLGLIVMIIILKPIINVLNSSGDFNLELINSSYHFDKSQLAAEVKRIEESNVEGIVEVYKRKLAEDITNYIKGQGNYKEVQADVYIHADQSQDNFGEIVGIDIFIIEGPQDSYKKEEAKIEPVRPVSVLINKGDNKSNAREVKDDSEMYNGIKNKISSFYNVDKENISIYIQKNN